MVFHDPDYAPDAFEVKISELLVATPEGSDALIDASVSEVLRLLREHLKMDVVFVSEFVDGRRVFRRVDTSPESRVGRVYGTLCCFSFAPNEQLTQRDLKKLEMSAQLTAKRINERRARDVEKAMADWSLQPQDASGHQR